MNRRIIAIIGSSKFKSAHLGVAQRETLRGHVVLLTGFWHHVDMVPITDEQKASIDRLSFDKIEMAAEVVVVNVNGYIGESTWAQIAHAEKLGKPVRYLEQRE
jgi:hypothetical protein